MLDLIEFALEADRFARQARNARCCDALRPCRACADLRLKVRARRLVVRCPRGLRRPVTRISLAPRYLTERLAS